MAGDDNLRLEIQQGIDASVLRRAVDRLTADEQLPADAQKDIKTAVLDRVVAPRADVDLVLPDPCRPAAAIDELVDPHVGTFTDLTQVIPPKLTAFYLGMLGIGVVRITAKIVTKPKGLCRPVQLVVCEREPEATDHEKIQRFNRELDRLSRLDWLPWLYNVLRDVDAQLKAWWSPRVSREQMVDELPFLSRIAQWFELRVGSVEIDEEGGFPQLLPPFYFWKSSSNARKLVCADIDERLRSALHSKRDTVVPYGLWFDRRLVPVPDDFFDDPTVFASVSTIAEELIAHLCHPYVRAHSLASYGVDSSRNPYPVLCATVNPRTGRFVCVRPTISVADGDLRVTLRLTLVTREEVMVDSRMRIRRVDVR